MMARMGANVRNVLWTAGWDSTFRVADLVLNHRSPVQPHYVEDWRRPSTPMELRRQEEIRAAIGRLDREAARLIRPTVVHAYDEIPTDPRLRALLEEARREGFLGAQYVFLTAMARAAGLADLELCVHRDDKAAALLAGDVEHHDDGAGGYHSLVPAPSRVAAELLRPFRFPLFDLTKVEMEQRAAAGGFGEVMELTWFCHYPTRSGGPCGICNPCRYTREEGLGRRVPPATRRRRVVHHVRRKGGAVRRRVGHLLGTLR